DGAHQQGQQPLQANADMQDNGDHHQGEHHAGDCQQDNGQPIGLQPIKLGVPGSFEEQGGNKYIEDQVGIDMLMWQKWHQPDNKADDDQQQGIGYTHEPCQQSHDQGHNE